VYKAKRGGATDVACKVMRLDLLEGGAREQQLEAFMREAAVLKACRDQHILMFLGACLKARRALPAAMPVFLLKKNFKVFRFLRFEF